MNSPASAPPQLVLSSPSEGPSAASERGFWNGLRRAFLGEWSERASQIAFRTAGLMLIGVTIVLVGLVRASQRDVQLVRRTNIIIDHGARLLTEMLDIQNTARRFVVTDSAAALDAYQQARARVHGEQAAMAKLLSTDTTQLARLATVNTLVRERIALAEQVIALRRTDGFDAAESVLQTGQGSTLMYEIREAIDRLSDLARQQLAVHVESSDVDTARTHFAIATLLTLSLFILWRADARIRSTMAFRNAAQHRTAALNIKLEQQNAALKLAREQASRGEQFKSAILGHAGHAIIATDKNFVIHSFNPAAERMLGYSADEMIGSRPDRFLDAQQIAVRAAEFSAELGEPIAPGLDVFVVRLRHGLPNQYVWTFTRKNATRFPALMSVTALRDEQGEITGFIGLATDITDRQRILDRLADKNSELKTFAYTVSHDLKAPLRGIAGYARELDRQHSGLLSERAQFCVAQIGVASNNLDALIEDLLTYSRLDSDLPTYGPVLLQSLVQRIVHERHRELEAHGVELLVDIPALTITTWERGLQQILANLVDNAVKYSQHSKPPKITISADVAGNRCRFTVADNGIGFDMRYHDRIFGLFHRLVRGDQYEGTGAGLAIVRRLTDKLGGTVGANSEPGAGATFFVEFPLPDANSNSA